MQCSAHHAPRSRVTIRPLTNAKPRSRSQVRRKPPTAEQIAKVVTAKLKSRVGMPDKAELSLKVVLPRAVLERLMARSIRESYPSLAAWVQAVLEREGAERMRARRCVNDAARASASSSPNAAARARSPTGP